MDIRSYQHRGVRFKNLREPVTSIPDQLHLNTEKPKKEKLVNLKQNDSTTMAYKPACGFWTSTYNEETNSSAWNDWICQQTGLDATDDKKWILVPEDQASVYQIKNFEDVLKITHKPEKRTANPDFLSLMEHCDGIWLTEEGYENAHNEPINGNILIGAWACKSIFWFRWAFKSVESLTD
jgi:hypothetical protein